MAKKFRQVKEKKQKIKPAVWMGLFFVAIMITSVIGFMWKGNENTNKYNNHIFTQTQNGWSAKINGKEASFTYFPGEVNQTPIQKEIIDRFKNTKMFYITYDPDQESVQFMALAQYDIANNLWQASQIYSEPGFTKPVKDYGISIITCSNATQSVPVLQLIEGNNTSVFMDGDCIIMESEGTGFIYLKDRLLYGIFGIIE